MHQAAAALGACQNCVARYLNFRPTPEEPCLWQGRKTKDNSRSITCAAVCLGCAGCSGLAPRAAQCLEGRWARCRQQPTAIHPCGRATTSAPGRISLSEGENAAWCSGHGPPAQADGRGPPPAAGPAWHVVLCGHRSIFSSPPGSRMFRLLAFFHEPSKTGRIRYMPGYAGACVQNEERFLLEILVKGGTVSLLCGSELATVGK